MIHEDAAVRNPLRGAVVTDVVRAKTSEHLQLQVDSRFVPNASMQLTIGRPRYVSDALLASVGPPVAVGIGIEPPGESAFAAVKTSTPVSVTSKVCSIFSLALDHR